MCKYMNIIKYLKYLKDYVRECFYHSYRDIYIYCKEIPRID